MTSLRALLITGLAALAGGIIVSILLSKVPARGWVGILLVLVAGTAWVWAENVQTSSPSRLALLAACLLFAPITLVYSFLVMRKAPDRIAAYAAFVGSTLVGVCLIATLAGFIATLFAL